jgi:hypothetical protein
MFWTRRVRGLAKDVGCRTHAWCGTLCFVALTRTACHLETSQMNDIIRKVTTHEAGHIVVAWKYGWQVEFARLGNDILNDTSEVRLVDSCDPDNVLCGVYEDVEIVEKYQTYFAAGAAAEVLRDGEYRPESANGDFQWVTKMEELKRSHAHVEMDEEFDPHANFKVFVGRATGLLESLLIQVETVALTLAEQRSLSFETLAQLQGQPRLDGSA